MQMRCLYYIRRGNCFSLLFVCFYSLSLFFFFSFFEILSGVHTAEGISTTSDLLDYIKEDLEGKLDTTQTKIEKDVDARIKAKLANKR